MMGNADSKEHQEINKEADHLAAALEESLQIKDKDENDDKVTHKKEDETKVIKTTVKVDDEKQKEINDHRAKAPPALVRVADWIQQGDASRILVLTGAGVSCAAGIPDFRTPGTGLYDNLQQYNLPFPEAVFDLEFYAHNPQPFCQLAKELWPGLKFLPTLTHSFLTLLYKKGLLLRCYTQNIDGLEHLANLPADNLVECHGHFRTASCIACGREAKDSDKVRRAIVEKGEVPRCTHCKGYVKPDIVFFGEGLPSRFHSLLRKDLLKADTCLILGTSLAVAPVSNIPDMINPRAKRILLNRELVGNLKPHVKDGRDVYHGDDCDASIECLAKLLGWWDELQTLHQNMQNALKATQKDKKKK